MYSSSIAAVTGFLAIMVVGVLAIIAIFNKRWNSELAFVLGSLAIAGISAIALRLVNPGASILPILPRMAGTVVAGLALAGGARLVRSHFWSDEPNAPLPPENPFSQERFSFERVFKASLVVLAIAAVVFALWLWWLVEYMARA